MFSLFFSKYGKIIGLVVTVLGGMASVIAVVNYYENKGYNRAIVEIQSEANEAIAKATQAAIEKAEKKVRRALEIQHRIFQSELLRARNERKIETKIKEVIKYVDRIEIDPNCAVVSDDIIVLLNKTVDTVNNPDN